MSINHKNISVKIFMPRFFVSKSFHSQKTPLPYHFPKSSLFDSRKNPETRIPRHHNLKFRCIYDFEAIEAAVNRSTNRQLGGTNVSERTNKHPQRGLLPFHLSSSLSPFLDPLSSLKRWKGPLLRTVVFFYRRNFAQLDLVSSIENHRSGPQSFNKHFVWSARGVPSLIKSRTNLTSCNDEGRRKRRRRRKRNWALHQRRETNYDEID